MSGWSDCSGDYNWLLQSVTEFLVSSLPSPTAAFDQPFVRLTPYSCLRWSVIIRSNHAPENNNLCYGLFLLNCGTLASVQKLLYSTGSYYGQTKVTCRNLDFTNLYHFSSGGTLQQLLSSPSVFLYIIRSESSTWHGCWMIAIKWIVLETKTLFDKYKPAPSWQSYNSIY